MLNEISIKGLILAMLASLALAALGGVVGVTVFAESMTVKALHAIDKQANFLIFSAIVGALATILGGYISAKYGKEAVYRNAFSFGLLSLVLGLLVAEYDPVWIDILGFISVIPLSMLGGYVFVRKSA